MLDSVYGAQIASGFMTGLLVAPIVSVVDQSIISHASGREAMLKSMKRLGKEMVTQPVRFIATPTFAWVAAVFCATYASANVAEEYCIRREELKDNTAQIKFMASSSCNIPISAMKDRAFAHMFSTANVGHVVRAVPKMSVALFALRDGMTVGSSFALPQILSPYLQSHFEISEYAASTTALLGAPLMAQVFSTPLFVLGLDLANHGDNPAGRMGRMAKLYVPTLLARWARIFPAFSIGGCANRAIRDELVTNARLLHWRTVTYPKGAIL